MTAKKVRITPRGIFVTIFSTLLFILAIKYSNSAIASVKSALWVCAETVIPSLFPFMVISELAVSLGAAKYIGKILSPIFDPLFDLNEHSASAFLLGALCGFPVGARTAVSLYECGSLNEKELTHVLCFCNNPSSAFVINAIGISLFGSQAFGIALYFITLISALIIGICLKFFFREKTVSKKESKKETKEEKTLGIHIFTNAVTNSANAMLSVCAFIVFFSAFLGALNTALEPISIPDHIISVVKGFFELTAGVTHLSANLYGENALLLCAFIVGWSGLSVHFQIMSICRNCKISFRPYFVSKVAHGGLNALIMCAYLRIFKPNLSFYTETDIKAFLYMSKPWTIICLTFFAGSTIILIIKKRQKRTKKNWFLK